MKIIVCVKQVPDTSGKVAVKALKKAEDTDELIVRVYEWTGEDQQDVRLSFPVPILSAREVNGIEESLTPDPSPGRGEESMLLADSSIVFSIGHYQPLTFAVRLQQLLPSPRRGVGGEALSLPYNIDLMSYDTAPGNAASTYAYAYPAELIPDTLVADGIHFVMGPRGNGEKNVLRLSSEQVLSLGEQAQGHKLYLLLASPTAAGATVTVTAGDEVTELSVPYFTGRAAEPPSCTTLTESYRRENIVFASSHAHGVSSASNLAMQMLYIYKYGIGLPEGVGEVTIRSSDRKTFLFAATVSDCRSDDVETFTPLTTEIETPGNSSISSFPFSMDNRLVPRSVSASHYNSNNEAARNANDQDPTTKWCVTSSQSQTPWLQYLLRDTATVTGWMVLGAARESGGYVARAFKLQYQADDGTWVDADAVEDNQMNKVVRTLPQPVTATRVRLQMVQGEQEAYTTRIYEFAVYGYLKGDDPTGLQDLKDPKDLNDPKDLTDPVFNLSGQRVTDTGRRGIYIHRGRKVVRP